jgi:hypothetical protein
MRDRLKQAKRRLKVESRQAISLRSQADQNQQIVDAVIQLVQVLTGKDARKLAKKEYRAKGQSGSFGAVERGILVNILPNLIAEAVNTGRKGDEEKGDESAG